VAWWPVGFGGDPQGGTLTPSMAAKRTKAGPKVEEVVPSAARTIGSLRDVGYDLPRAVADIVDNSIAAQATQVDVTIRFNGSDSWIRIADNGAGMDAATLLEAMRYGSERDYDSNDLGRFGFGLKTASTSQCRRLTVATRRSSQYRRFEVRCLDLAHVEATNKWQVLVLEGAERRDHMLEPLQEGPGTVVVWEDLDRVLDYKDPWGGWAKRRMLDLAEEVDEHLAMVFHRFLAGEVRGRRLTLTINGSKVSPWDPFCRDEPKTLELPAKDMRVTSASGSGIVRVRPYVMPQQNEFSDDAAWRRASGPARWNRQQGLYVYRANRLIQPGGGWNRIRTLDEHTKLARVAVDFFPVLDSAFGINIAKAFVQLPEDLRGQLEPLVNQVARQAEQRYRSGGARSKARERTTGVADARPGGSGQSGAPRGDDATGRPERSGPAGRGPQPDDGGAPQPEDGGAGRAIEAAAKAAGEAKALGRIVDVLRSSHPEVARGLGW
jgi:hypothetical protein